MTPALSLILLVISIVIFAICCLAGFGVFTLHHLTGWEFLGFLTFAAAHLPANAP